MLNPAQSRAARGLVDWSQTRLASSAGISLSTIRDFETGKRTPTSNNLASIKAALEAAGVIFVGANEVSAEGGPGVRLSEQVE